MKDLYPSCCNKVGQASVTMWENIHFLKFEHNCYTLCEKLSEFYSNVLALTTIITFHM